MCQTIIVENSVLFCFEVKRQRLVDIVGLVVRSPLQVVDLIERNPGWGGNTSLYDHLVVQCLMILCFFILCVFSFTFYWFVVLFCFALFCFVLCCFCVCVVSCCFCVCFCSCLCVAFVLSLLLLPDVVFLVSPLLVFVFVLFLFWSISIVLIFACLMLSSFLFFDRLRIHVELLLFRFYVVFR